MRLFLRTQPGAKFASQAHFFAAAAEAMRRILVENARRKQRLKHGGGQRRIDIDSLDVAITTETGHLLAVDDVLDKLAARDPLAANLVKLRFFAGLSNLEAARLLGLAVRTAKGRDAEDGV